MSWVFFPVLLDWCGRRVRGFWASPMRLARLEVSSSVSPLAVWVDVGGEFGSLGHRQAIGDSLEVGSSVSPAPFLGLM